MQQYEAEVCVKGLQKSFLYWIEEHEQLCALDPALFNEIRKRVFRATFATFRMGIVGLTVDKRPDLLDVFLAWIPNIAEIDTQIDWDVLSELEYRCLFATLEAFRLGALCKGAD